MGAPQKLDFLIIGQGLAGSLLSYFLMKKGKSLKVLDFPHQGRTSNIAAGLINPVTGRRIAKSWRFEDLLPFARQTYKALEAELGIPLWHDRQIARALHTVFEENEWLRRSSFPEFTDYLHDEPELGDTKQFLNQPHAWGELRLAAQVELPRLIECWQDKLKSEGLFVSEDVDYGQFEMHEQGVHYKGLSASMAIFCEGGKAVANPFFNYLPFLVTKGELLLVKIPSYQTAWIIKHNLFLIPLANGLFWVGATSRYEFDGPLPSPQGREWLLAELGKTLTVPFEVMDHLAGIRPTVADVRPLLGQHPSCPQLAIFNGLGTKGALMGPFFAKQMADNLLGAGNLDAEVNIARFGQAAQKGHFFKIKGT